ncbi:MAG: hypothetical protein AB1467_01960 [Candidatus Diapherotrites archaeon]
MNKKIILGILTAIILIGLMNFAGASSVNKISDTKYEVVLKVGERDYINHNDAKIELFFEKTWNTTGYRGPVEYQHVKVFLYSDPNNKTKKIELACNPGLLDFWNLYVLLENGKGSATCYLTGWYTSQTILQVTSTNYDQAEKIIIMQVEILKTDLGKTVAATKVQQKVAEVEASLFNNKLTVKLNKDGTKVKLDDLDYYLKIEQVIDEMGGDQIVFIGVYKGSSTDAVIGAKVSMKSFTEHIFHVWKDPETKYLQKIRFVPKEEKPDSKGNYTVEVSYSIKAAKTATAPPTTQEQPPAPQPSDAQYIGTACKALYSDYSCQYVSTCDSWNSDKKDGKNWKTVSGYCSGSAAVKCCIPETGIPSTQKIDCSSVGGNMQVKVVSQACTGDHYCKIEDNYPFRVLGLQKGDFDIKFENLKAGRKLFIGINDNKPSKSTPGSLTGFKESSSKTINYSDLKSNKYYITASSSADTITVKGWDGIKFEFFSCMDKSDPADGKCDLMLAAGKELYVEPSCEAASITIEEEAIEAQPTAPSSCVSCSSVEQCLACIDWEFVSGVFKAS